MTGILTRCSLSKCPMLFKDSWESSYTKDIHFFIKKSKFLRGQQSPFFQGRKTNKSNLTGRRQRKRVTDVAGLLQLHLTQRVTRASPRQHSSLIPAQSSCPWSSKEEVSLLEGEPEIQKSDPARQSAHPPHLYPGSPHRGLPSSPTQAYTLAPVFTGLLAFTGHSSAYSLSKTHCVFRTKFKSLTLASQSHAQAPTAQRWLYLQALTFWCYLWELNFWELLWCAIPWSCIRSNNFHRNYSLCLKKQASSIFIQI